MTAMARRMRCSETASSRSSLNAGTTTEIFKLPSGRLQAMRVVQRTSSPEQIVIGERRVEIRRQLDARALQAAKPHAAVRACAGDRRQAHQGLARACDDHLLAGQRPVEQRGELRFRFVDIELHAQAALPRSVSLS